MVTGEFKPLESGLMFQDAQRLPGGLPQPSNWGETQAFRAQGRSLGVLAARMAGWHALGRGTWRHSSKGSPCKGTEEAPPQFHPGLSSRTLETPEVRPEGYDTWWGQGGEESCPSCWLSCGLDGTPLAVWWLRIHISTSRGMGSVPGWETKILHAAWFRHKNI